MPKLTAKQLRKLLTYNPTNGLFHWKPPHHRRGIIAGTRQINGYCFIQFNQQHRYYAHRLAWLYVHGRWPTKNLDHINGDPFDNRIDNLREATQRQNLQNARPHRDNTSGFKGVRQLPSGNWHVRIKVKSRQLHIGTFPTAKEAHAAYCVAAIKHFGQFARAH